MQLGVHSEIGKLRKVMVSRPSLAHERLTPGNCHDLLFDDVIWVQKARSDHADFVLKMEDRDIEVYDIQDLLTDGSRYAAADADGVALIGSFLPIADAGIKSQDASVAVPTTATNCVRQEPNPIPNPGVSVLQSVRGMFRWARCHPHLPIATCPDFLP